MIIISYDETSRVAFYIVVLTRLCHACTLCERQRTRIAVALFALRDETAAVDGDWDAKHSEAPGGRLRDMSIQLLHQPIRVTVLGGLMVLNYALLRSVRRRTSSSLRDGGANSMGFVSFM